MARTTASQIEQIELGALDSKRPLADVLRRCVALGGRSGSEQLRDWARLELDGYSGGDHDLPRYRTVTAALCIDGSDSRKIVTGQQISTFDIPEFAREAISASAPIPYGVAELERLAKHTESIKMQDSMMPELVHLMNRQNDRGSAIHAMYWQISSASIHGILDTIRTNLVALAAEMRAAGTTDVPTPEAADQAVQVVIHGVKRSSITVNTHQASGSGDGSRAFTPPPSTAATPRVPSWVRGPWGFAVGAAGIVGAVAGVATWAG
ncbi:hypothetical protein [Quadrisphaera sp. INWT6]|uniref:AbiTii domain-containing protein n=1 Tax=Quadrisphaera sp. INWT6 TaxID=2596917 RepID=UPI001891F6F3|nr:hypothetical protein [Quadrisphaera sp. INWT6]MBF5082338.1 hypothetical protein [Quadrisphaera sp. INWT6]